MHFLPQTKLGKWALGLVFLWPILTILGSVIANSIYSGIEAGDGIIDDLIVRPFLAVTMLMGIACGLVSFALSLGAIFKGKEHSILTFITLLIGLFLATLLIGETFVKH